jgi:hypothetical protein
MNKRRLSFGLLVTLGAAMMIGCGEPEPATPPQATAAPEASATPAATTTAEAAPPPAPEPPPPPPPPPPPAKDSFTGKLSQDYSGEVAEADKAAADKAGGPKKDQKKIDAKAKALKGAFDKVARTIEISGTTMTVSEGGKVKKTYTIEMAGGDEKGFTLKLTKDGKKDIKPPTEIKVSLSGGVFSFTDPWAKKDGKNLAFKK